MPVSTGDPLRTDPLRSPTKNRTTGPAKRPASRRGYGSTAQGGHPHPEERGTSGRRIRVSCLRSDDGSLEWHGGAVLECSNEKLKP